MIIDFQSGIYDASHPERIYEISGKRKKVVKYLCENKVAALSDLIATTGQLDPLVVKEIGEINNNFMKFLKTEKELIVNSPTAGGYKLNKQEFIIKIPETSA